MIQFHVIPKQFEIALRYLGEGLKSDFDDAKLLVFASALALPFLVALVRFVAHKIGLTKSIVHLFVAFSLSIAAYMIFASDLQNGVHVILKYVVVLWVFFEIMRAIAKAFNSTAWLQLLLSLFFLFLASVTFAFIDLVALYAVALFERYRSLYLLTRNIAKGTSALAFLFFAYSFWPSFKTKAPERWQRAWRQGTFWILLVFLSITALWIGGQFRFTIKILIGLSFLSVLLALWLYLYAHAYRVTRYLYRNVDLEIGETMVLARHLVRLVFLILIYGYYRFLNHFLKINVDGWFEKIKIIESNAYVLSLGNLLWGLYIFVFLFSALMLGAKYLRQLTGGKAFEDLLENLGFLMVFVIALIILRIPWQVIAAVGGALSVGIGIGSSALIGNYFASLVLLFSNRLKIGDIVEVNGSVGKMLGGEEAIFGWVKDIGAWSTTIRSFDHFDIYVPNVTIITDKMINYSAAGHLVRTHFQIAIPRVDGVDDQKIRDLINTSFEEVGQNQQRVRENKIFLADISKDLLIYHISVSIDARTMGNFREFQNMIREKVLQGVQSLAEGACYNTPHLSRNPMMEKPDV